MSNISFDAARRKKERLRQKVENFLSLPVIQTRIKPFFLLGLRVGLLLLCYVLLVKWMSHTGHLPEERYAQPVIALELLKRSLAWWPLLLIGAMLAVWRRDFLMAGWQTFVYGHELRLITGVIAAICGWAFSTYDINLYFNQVHLLDRLLLAALALLVLWKPVFVLPFTYLLVSMVWQFDYPLATQYPWTEMNMPVRILALFGAAFILHLITGRLQSNDFLFLMLCLISTFYWGSGVGKFKLNWISHRHLYLLPMGAYSNGWLGFLKPEAIVSISQAIKPLTLPMMLFTLFVEWGAILFLLLRKLSIVMLFSFIAFHLAVFAITGMFFWKWIVIEVLLLLLFFIRKPQVSLPVYTPSHFLLSVFIIGAGTLWFWPTNLSWYDTPLSYTYRMVGIGESGSEHLLPNRTFTPYADTFTLGNFGYLNRQPQLTHIWGVTVDRAIATRLLNVRSLADVEALENEHMRMPFNESRCLQFDQFIQAYVGHLNERKAKPLIPRLLQAPPHLWSQQPEPVFPDDEQLTKVIVYQVTWLYDGESYSPIRRQIMREIEIPRAGGNRQ